MGNEIFKKICFAPGSTENKRLGLGFEGWVFLCPQSLPPTTASSVP